MRLILAFVAIVGCGGAVASEVSPGWAPTGAPAVDRTSAWSVAEPSATSRHPELEQRFVDGRIEPVQLEALGRLNETGYLSGEVDLWEAALWYERAVEAGVASAAVRLGWLWLQAAEGDVAARPVPGGQTAPLDRGSRPAVQRIDAERRAEAWFARAAELGVPAGKTALASLWVIQTLDARADMLGGVADDDGPALDGGAHARRDDRPDTSNAAGAAGRVRSMDDALRLLGEAVDAGDADAAVLLARVHLEGLAGQPVDVVRGAAAAEAGARLGNVLLQGWTARLYAEGVGVPQDLVRAYAWALLAAAEGDALGRQLRQWLSAELDERARREALDMASGWVLHVATTERLPQGLRDAASVVSRR